MTAAVGVPAAPDSPTGEADRSAAPRWAPALKLALVVCQLAALLALIRVFELENRTVYGLLIGVVLAFVVHDALPQRFRLPFFAALSLASVPVVLGLKAGAFVVASGGLLIGLCHLPVRFQWRLGLLLSLTAVLMVLRGSPRLTGFPDVVWVVLGAMFMFRLALYLHSVRHADAPHGLAWSVAYLFMVPNVCYPLFPVVDYKTFVRAHFDTDRYRIYDRAVRLMLRGAAQLLIYRAVYYDLALDGLYVNDLADVVRYVVATFLLYVKISGQFWLIIGVLGLFGFRLPDTNHLYFLATGPTDFWRRINIYWKDFMMKLVYYPSFFRLRRYGNTLAIAAATLVVFGVTWSLHAYQYFWLEGAWAQPWRDLAFWGVFGVLVIVATLWEIRPAHRRPPKTDRSWSLTRGLLTVATFTVIAVLWSLWNARSFPTWLYMWSRASYATPATWLALSALGAAAIVLAGFAWGAPTLQPPQPGAEPLAALARRTVLRLAAVGGFLAVATPALWERLPEPLAAVPQHLRGRGSSLAGVAVAEVGYYERLTQFSDRAAAPWRVPVRHDSDWRAILRARRDFVYEELIPSNRTTFLGKPFTTNSWGMRGAEYGLAKPPTTYRIAVFGPSDVMGWGVADGEAFPSLLERMLDSAARGSGWRVEVLNFGTAATSLVQQVYALEGKGLRFAPDLVLLAVHPYDLASLQQNFRRVMESGYAIPDTGVARLTASVGVGPGLKGNLADLRLVEEAIDRRLLERAQELGAQAGAAVAALALRIPDVTAGGNFATTRRAADAARIPMLDCASMWIGQRTADFRLSVDDAHPNAAGQRLIASCVFEQLRRGARVLRIRPLLPAAPEAASARRWDPAGDAGGGG